MSDWSILFPSGTSEGPYTPGQVEEEVPQTPQIAASLLGSGETTASRQQVETRPEKELSTFSPSTPSPGVSENQERTAVEGEEILTEGYEFYEGRTPMITEFSHGLSSSTNLPEYILANDVSTAEYNERGRPADDKLADEEREGEKAGGKIPDLVPRSADDTGINSSWRLEHLDPSLR